MKNQLQQKIAQTDKKYIIGVDECGTGSLVGDVYVCAFVAPKDWAHEGLTDSKKLSAKKREEICQELLYSVSDDIGFSVVNVHPNNLDEYKEYGNNLHGALKYLYWKSVSRILKKDALIVLDGIIKFPEHPIKLADAVSLPKADLLIPQVSAASVIGKVFRDNYMVQLSKKYPKYDWSSNKGYPAKSHLDKIKEFGYCEEHRINYEPIKSMIKNEKW